MAAGLSSEGWGWGGWGGATKDTKATCTRTGIPSYTQTHHNTHKNNTHINYTHMLMRRVVILSHRWFIIKVEKLAEHLPDFNISVSSAAIQLICSSYSPALRHRSHDPPPTECIPLQEEE